MAIDNLKLAQELLVTMQQVTVQLEKQTETYTAQAKLVEAICKAQECFAKVDAGKVKEVTESLKQAQKQTEGFGTAAQTVMGHVDKLGGFLKNLADKAAKLSVPIEFINGFKSGFTLSTSLFKNIMSLGGSALDLLKDVGMTLLSIPGRIMDFFQNAAGSGVDPYRQALEDLRKEFGDLKVGMSASVKGMTEDMKGFSQSGLRFSRVFGYGREGLTKLLQENMELAKGMGTIFNRFAKDIRGAEADVTVLRKATTLGAEAFKSLQLIAENAGINTGQAVKNLTKDIARASRAFGISAKEMGKDLDYMMKETASFGILAPQTMLKVSVYTRKLGISMEALKGIMEKTLNFEDTAQQVAKLSEAFNVQIDAMKLMNEQDPTKKMDLYRQAFFKTGLNIEQMTVAQKKYWADTTGMTDDTMRLAFAQKNRALSGNQLDAQMKKAQKTQISQAEAMKQLAKSIERLVLSGNALKGSFFDIFMKGFERGIHRTREFREVTRNLQRSLRTVLYAGREVGRMFVKEFPGIKDILKGLADMFSPSRFRGLMKNVVAEFKKFFALLKTDPAAGVEQFMKNMKKIFFDFFNQGTPAGKKFLDGLKTFYTVVGKIFVAGIKHALFAVKDLLKGIIEFIRNPAATLGAAAEVGDGLKGMFVQALRYCFKELGPVLKDVGALFVGLLTELYTKYVAPHMQKIIFGAIAFFFGPAIVLGFVRGAVAALLGQGVPAVIGAISRARSGVAAATGENAATRGAPTTATPEQAAKDVEKKSKGMKSLAKAMMYFTLAASGVVAAIVLLALLIKATKVTPAQMAMATLTFGAVAILFAGLIRVKFFEMAAAFGKTMDKGGFINLLKGIGAGLLVMGAMMVAIAGFIAVSAALLSKVSESSVKLVSNVLDSSLLLILKLAGAIVVLGLVGAALVNAPVVIPFVLAGLAAIGIMMLSLSAFASDTIAPFVSRMQQAKITPEYAERVGGILLSFVDLIVRMSFAMSLLAASAPFLALGGILNVLGGGSGPFASLTSIITTIKDSFMQILPVLNRMTGDPAILKEKAAVFSAITTGLAALVDPVAKLVADVSDDIFAGGSAKAAASAARSMTDVIKTLVDSRTGVIPPLLTQIQGMALTTANVDPAKLKAAAEVFAVIATGLAEIMKAVAGVLEKFDSGIIINPLTLLGSALSMKAKIKAMTEVTASVIPAINTAVRGMTGELVTLSASITNIEGLKALGPIISSVSTVLGSVLTSVAGMTQGPTSPMVQWQNYLAGITETSAVGEKLRRMGEFITDTCGEVTKLFVGDGPARPGLTQAIRALIREAPTDDTKIKGLTVVAHILKSITGVIVPLIEAVGGMTQQIDPRHANSWRLAATAAAMTQVINTMTESLRQIFTALPTLVSQLSGIELPPNLVGKTKALKGVLDLVASLGTIMKGFTVATTGGGTRAMNLWKEVFLPIVNLLKWFALPKSDGGHRILFEKVLNGLNDLNFPRGLRSKLTSLKSVFDVLKSASEAAKGLREMAGENNAALDPYVLNIPLRNLAVLIEGLGSDTAGGFRNPLTNPAAFDKITAIQGNLRGKGRLLTDLGASVAEVMVGAGRMGDMSTLPETVLTGTRVNLERLAGDNGLLAILERFFTPTMDFTGAGDIGARLATITENIQGGVTANVRAMVTAYNAFSQDMANLAQGIGARPLDISLRQLGDAMGARETVNIKTAIANTTININVRMDTGDLIRTQRNYSQRMNESQGSNLRPAFLDNAFNASTRWNCP